MVLGNEEGSQVYGDRKKTYSELRTHNAYIDDALRNCKPGTYVSSANQCHPNKFNNKKQTTHNPCYQKKNSSLDIRLPSIYSPTSPIFFSVISSIFLHISLSSLPTLQTSASICRTSLNQLQINVTSSLCIVKVSET